MAAQEDQVSLNRWVFKWHLKVRMLLHSRMSAGREFQVDGAATEKAQRTSSVCMRGMTSSRASDERRARGGAWSAPCESVGYRLLAASPEASVVSEAVA